MTTRKYRSGHSSSVMLSTFPAPSVFMDVYILSTTMDISSLCFLFALEKSFPSLVLVGSVHMFDVFWMLLKAVRLMVAAKSINGLPKVAVSLANCIMCLGPEHVSGAERRGFPFLAPLLKVKPNVTDQRPLS